MNKVPEREAAKAAGERFYYTGKPCRNGHNVKRYTATGICSACAVKNTLASQKKQPWHPARIAAKNAGNRHYSTGAPCKHGHPDKRFVANGICVQCSIDRCKQWNAARPGYEAAAARRRRAKDPTGHRAEVKKWRKNNREAAREILNRWKRNNPERAKNMARAGHQTRRTRVAKNGGRFTADDIEALHKKQNGKCAVCPSTESLEVDHILPVILGGSSDPYNLQLLCLPCNRSKGGKHPDVWLRELDDARLRN